MAAKSSEQMHVWQPAPAEVELLAWWRPLLLVSRRVVQQQMPWPVHFDEFQLIGRIDRPGRPAVWIYQHRVSQGCIHVDEYGQTYRYVSTPGRAASGRFEQITVQECVHLADLPEVTEPVEHWVPDRSVRLTGGGGRSPAQAPSASASRSAAAHPANHRNPSAINAGRRRLHAVPSAEPA